MQKIMLLTAAFIFILITTAHADNQPKTITKEYEFKTTDTDFDYNAPMEIIEDDVKYTRKKIRYKKIKKTPQILIETKTFHNEIFKEGLKEKDDTLFKDSIEFSQGEYKGLLNLKEIIYTERKVEGRTASHKAEYDYGLQVTKPDPLPTIDVLYHDEETNVNVLVTLSFKKLEETTKSHWEHNIHVQQRYRSLYEDEYLLYDGTRLSFTTDKPKYEDIEDKILKQMRLDSEKHIITNSSWLRKIITINGKTSRLAAFVVKRYVTGYKAIYSGSFDIPNIIVYDATALYESELTKLIPDGIEYTVKAIVTYEKEAIEEIPIKNNNMPIIVGTSTGIIGLCGLVFFLVKHKKKKH